MANIYVRSGAGGGATGVDWANAYLTLSAALAGGAAGDTFWVSEDHAETTAGNVALLSPGTPASPCQIYCVNHAGSVPPVAADLRTTATVSATGDLITVFFQGGVSRCYGITFTCSNSTNRGSISILNANVFDTEFWVFDTCALVIGGSGGSLAAGFCLIVGGNDTRSEAKATFINTTVSFANSSQGIYCRANGHIFWKNTPSALAGTAVTGALFSAQDGQYPAFPVELDGVDLSNYTSTALFEADNAWDVSLNNCKLGVSGIDNIFNTPTSPFARLRLTNCDNGATNYQLGQKTYFGSQQRETTIIRTGGASNGTTGYSDKIITTAHVKPLVPYEALPIAEWNDNSGASKTATIFGIWGGGAVPNNNDIWFELEYPGSASFPQSSLVSCGLATPISVAAGQPTDTSTWGGSTTPFKMQVTFTPQMKGWVTARVYCGAASQTFYVDPKLVIT